ncbi:MAG: sugar O-acetyltransferase [Parabacteroides sp.]|nr:sugar O-acetyltransferase [Parabacteroides sp.]
MRTEKEKMLAGELYDCRDTELINRWHLAKQLQKEYNNTPSDDTEKLSVLLDKLIGSRGENVWISAPIFVDYGENIHIGRNVEINMNCVFLDCNTITIGDYSGIGPGVHIYTVFHPTIPQERLGKNSCFWKSLTAPVNIGKNVWIGGGSIILPGVSIGDGTTIGAGSVVTRDIPPHSIAVGNPCRVIKEIKD